jgi:hypothetical protein
MRLGDLAVSWGLLGRRELQLCLQFQEGLRRRNTFLKIGQVMVRLDYISSTQLVALLDVQKKIMLAGVEERVR